MKKNIIIFDLDGTLLNTLEDLADSTNIALLHFNYPQRSIDEIRNFVGNGVAKLIERAIPGGASNPDYKNCLEYFKKTYSKNMYNKTAPYNGIIDMLNTLRSNGFKTAVVSNKFDIAVKELCKRYFPGLIDFAAGENEAEGIRKKPAPDTVLKVLKVFNADKSLAVYVGDSEVDIMTAQNSGIPCISVSWGFKNKPFLVEHGAEFIADTPEDIIYYLQNK